MAFKFKPLKRAGSLVLKSKYRSKLEERIAKQLEAAGVKFTYETEKIGYVVPARNAKYTPDFPVVAGEKKILIEAKGYFRTAAERQKLILVKTQYPEIDLRLVFQKANNPIYKGSPTSNKAWAEAHGIPWADGGIIPDDWLKEMTNEIS